MNEMNKPKILIATGNAGKVRELHELFRGVPAEFASLTDFPHIAEVPETGSTFTENASLKAVGYARQAGMLALADDSGLVVDALDGEPGVLSARFGGDVGFDQKMQLILTRMAASIEHRRTARFVCSMVVADPSGSILTAAEGICEGRIADAPRGRGGFGYDPIFVPDGHQHTFGELPDEIKAEISHRALAGAKIMRYLLAFTAV